MEGDARGELEPEDFDDEVRVEVGDRRREVEENREDEKRHKLRDPLEHPFVCEGWPKLAADGVLRVLRLASLVWDEVVRQVVDDHVREAPVGMSPIGGNRVRHEPDKVRVAMSPILMLSA